MGLPGLLSSSPFCPVDSTNAKLAEEDFPQLGVEGVVGETVENRLRLPARDHQAVGFELRELLRPVAAAEIAEVQVEAVDRSVRKAYAVPDWEVRAASLPSAPPRIRLLSPFDPILRDRRRSLRLFGFDYRFEAFVPAPQRRYGYYVLPILEGERLIGRLDPKLHRERGLLEIRQIWWEPKVRESPVRRRKLELALERLARLVGAERWTLPD